jgi:hypothetical protein
MQTQSTLYTKMAATDRDTKEEGLVSSETHKNSFGLAFTDWFVNFWGRRSHFGLTSPAIEINKQNHADAP